MGPDLLTLQLRVSSIPSRRPCLPPVLTSTLVGGRDKHFTRCIFLASELLGIPHWEINLLQKVEVTLLDNTGNFWMMVGKTGRARLPREAVLFAWEVARLLRGGLKHLRTFPAGTTSVRPPFSSHAQKSRGCCCLRCTKVISVVLWWKGSQVCFYHSFFAVWKLGYSDLGQLLV